LNTSTLENSRQTILHEFCDIGIKLNYSQAWGMGIRLGYTEAEFIKHIAHRVGN